ncbi:MAG: hypothetical protein U1E52_15270 [Geminicoccaceae bacterium]
MLTAVAAFAEAFVNPLTPLLVVGLALLIRRAALVRAAALLVGGVVGVVGHLLDVTSELAWSVLGAVAAWLLHAEIALHLVAPALRWMVRCVLSLWEITWLAFAVARRYLRGDRPEAGRPPEGKEPS